MAVPSLVTVWFVVSMATQRTLSAMLSYEAQDTVLDLMTERDFTGLATANLRARDGPRPIYRKDLGSSYTAYYEILSGDGKGYFLLSAGPKTGDNRFVESGEINVTARLYRPTDVLNMQARRNGQSCCKYYRLSQAGIYMCENCRGVTVAATHNCMSNGPVSGISHLKFTSK